MKIVKSIILASALCVSAFSLSGCAEAVKSQPVQASVVPSYWETKIGQKCTVHYNNAVSDGILKSADSYWVVISDVQETSVDDYNKKTDFVKEICVPTSSIDYVEFSKVNNSSNK